MLYKTRMLTKMSQDVRARDNGRTIKNVSNLRAAASLDVGDDLVERASLN